jgi:hypothetical protein
MFAVFIIFDNTDPELNSQLFKIAQFISSEITLQF